MASPLTPAGAVLPTRALLIKSQWLEPIFSGRKTWEVRGRDLRIRGRVCLASEGKLVGEVEFTDSLPIGVRDAGNSLVSVPGYDRNFIGLQANKDKTCIEDVTVLTYTRLFAWVMKDVLRYAVAIPYNHPLGAQQFVDLTRPGVVSATATSTSSSATVSEGQRIGKCGFQKTANILSSRALSASSMSE
ncbi:hypothetical protein AK812_SmicGene45104 [Symbiodinium microadriaticum]|uniref:ASCH domain-containing protein n=1 Tax=Symbiodinium microadriaticum TaxID=2951 RepID=A0A1Q9BWV9_SYMMI|nr:hypothetical protein AK812_SmicGene45104 [Symbiodinium microadriaticum]CAE7309347.1 unnamed protein product [Symbiodinium sp. KB8]